MPLDWSNRKVSLTDPFVIIYLKNRESWIIMRGRETFYNEDREMIEFKSSEKAMAYAIGELDARDITVEMPDEH